MGTSPTSKRRSHPDWKDAGIKRTTWALVTHKCRMCGNNYKKTKILDRYDINKEIPSNGFNIALRYIVRFLKNVRYFDLKFLSCFVKLIARDRTTRDEDFQIVFHFRAVLRGVSADFPHTYLLQKREIPREEITFLCRYVDALASRRESFGTDENSHAPGISVAPKIFGTRTRPSCHLSKHFSNASMSRIREQHLYIRYSPHWGIPSSYGSPAGKHVFRIRASLRYAASVCLRANTRGHAKEIACYSSI